MLISEKGKCFYVFGCISKNFPENIFWCLEKKKENTNPENTSHNPEKNHQRSRSEIAILSARSRDGAIAINVAISRRHDLEFARSRSRVRKIKPSIAILIRRRFLISLVCSFSRSCVVFSVFSLPLSAFCETRKWFEVKMRGVNDFRVKGENSGQLKVIFRKMIFSVTAKHSSYTENDFRKQLSPNSNTALIVK